MRATLKLDLSDAATELWRVVDPSTNRVYVVTRSLKSDRWIIRNVMDGRNVMPDRPTGKKIIKAVRSQQCKPKVGQ